jgi:hypothetical protein
MRLFSNQVVFDGINFSFDSMQKHNGMSNTNITSNFAFPLCLLFSLHNKNFHKQFTCKFMIYLHANFIIHSACDTLVVCKRQINILCGYHDE